MERLRTQYPNQVILRAGYMRAHEQLIELFNLRLQQCHDGSALPLCDGCWLALGAAANMHCAGLATARQDELVVGVAATAGVLHWEAVREAIRNQAAHLAATVAVQPDRFAEFRVYLQPEQGPVLAALRP